MAELVIKEVLTKKDRREFIFLPEKVHKNEPDWLPPIYLDEWELYNKKKNKSYQYADAILLLAYRDNKPVGRIMGIINNRYNAINNEQHGRFCFMECYNDNEGLHSLITSFFFQAEDGIRDAQESRGLGDVYKRQILRGGNNKPNYDAASVAEAA